MFHKEGHKIILLFLSITIIDILIVEYFIENSTLKIFIQILAFYFSTNSPIFRNPKRNTVISDDKILSPVDGKVVIIKKVFEKEYFKDERLQISVFMSPINVHVTRYPSSGEIVFSKYHPGDYLVAWHPKSSEKNERTTIVLKTKLLEKYYIVK